MSNGPIHTGSCPAHLRTGPCDPLRCGAQEEWNERQELHALRELVQRIRQWDMLDACADGAYWKREIDAVISVHSTRG